ncbi:MAG: dimethylhistidine N-methyltransferase [Betaproteobacteria bacterium RIFCSPLOWO2_02_FULL_62_17]|nr:MAG: dimethylhistidine N-methyltransferase [Betaproteobacteria bacterium RIFCSPLOWO2_02_FULL_62_17]
MNGVATPPSSANFGVDDAAAVAEIRAGLLQERAEVSPKYFYDPLGSKLFEAITQLPEYYPTRTERGIFERHGAEIARSVGTGAAMIELGAGNCDKARRLFPALRPAQYVAVDISTEFLLDALREMRGKFPDIEMQALGMDFSSGLNLPRGVRNEKRLFFYPGSSIGNFTPAAALELLRDLRRQCGVAGGVLIGVDLVKPASILEPAYDDALGVTAAFNLNLLNHLNRLIDANFNPGDWRHLALFNAPLSRIEMHLEARCDLTVSLPGGERRFARGERIHTESSYKYELLQFRALLVKAGFRNINTWTDERHWFAVCHASI